MNTDFLAHFFENPVTGIARDHDRGLSVDGSVEVGFVNHAGAGNRFLEAFLCNVITKHRTGFIIAVPAQLE